MASGPVTSWQIDGETMETEADFIFAGSKITADGDCTHEIKRCLLLGWRREWQSTPVFLPGEFHGQRSLVGYSPWGHKESDRRKAMINLDSILKSRDITLSTKVRLVKAMVFNMLSSLVIAFLPRSKHLLISWVQSLSAVILEPNKIKSDTVSIVSPSICHEVIRPDAIIFVV